MAFGHTTYGRTAASASEGRCDSSRFRYRRCCSPPSSIAFHDVRHWPTLLLSMSEHRRSASVANCRTGIHAAPHGHIYWPMRHDFRHADAASFARTRCRHFFYASRPERHGLQLSDATFRHFFSLRPANSPRRRTWADAVGHTPALIERRARKMRVYIDACATPYARFSF